MGIRERKPAAAQARSRQQPRPVDKAIAAEIRRRAEKLAAAVEIPGNNGVQGRNHQRQQTEQQMAKLRGEAVQARRLAEQIENLSRETAASRHIRKPAMTDTTIVDPGHAKRRQRKTDGKPGPSGNRLNFNPLHPSMELPPEQLIRLLGMESKKIRKSMKKRQAPKQAAAKKLPTETRKDDDGKEGRTPPAKAHPLAVSPVDRSIQYERCEAPQVFSNGYSGLLLPSLVVGVVAGIVVSAYLFWSQPADTEARETPTPATTAKQVPTTESRRQLVKRTAPTTASATKPKMSAQENTKWRAKVNAEEQRLRTAADQRLSERISQIHQPPQPAATQTAPVYDALPVPTAGPAAIPRFADEAVSTVDTRVERPSTEPDPATAGFQDAEKESAGIEDVQLYEDVPSATPGVSTEVMPAPVEMEPQTGRENTTTDKTLNDGFDAAVSAISDVEPEAYSSTETDLLPESVAPTDQ